MLVGENQQPHELIGLQVGKCVLERPLGVGGMGAVYLAQQLRPRRQVAVKVLQRGKGMDPQAWETFLTRFRREADAAAALDHANIVPIYEFGEDGDLAYLVMPYLADGSLAELLEREGTLPVRHALTYVEQAAAALDYAHAHGIVHRDVKTSNLLLHPDGRLLLADFGIARPLDSSDLTMPASSRFADGDGSLTQHGVVMGTPEYMAPEQIMHGPVSAATDVYALGIVAYAMLTGQTPFVDETPAAILTRQLREPPTPIRPLRPDVPAGIEEAIFWALAKNPEDRPASAGELARALRGKSQARGLGTLIGWHAANRRGTEEAGSAQTLHRASAARGEMGQAYRPPSSGEVTMTDGRYFGGGGVPEWPDPGGMRSQPSRQLPLIALLTVGGLVALIFIVVLANSFVGDLLTLSNQPTPGTGASAMHGTGTPLPTSTPKPTATPKLFPTNWLSVSDDSVTLGCKGKNQTRTIVLSNEGPEDVGWQAQISGGPFQSVTVTPNEGQLGASDSVRIAITSRSSFGFGQSGTITFQPDNGDAGEAPSVRYSIRCGGG
jgi:hypothetical protein